MTWYQVWGRPDEPKYIPCCKSCGEMLRSRPVYDGGTGFCVRKRCQKQRAKKEASETESEEP